MSAARERQAAELFVWTVDVRTTSHAEAVANAELDASSCGWSQETRGWVREMLCTRYYESRRSA